MSYRPRAAACTPKNNNLVIWASVHLWVMISPNTLTKNWPLSSSDIISDGCIHYIPLICFGSLNQVNPDVALEHLSLFSFSENSIENSSKIKVSLGLPSGIDRFSLLNIVSVLFESQV